MTTSLPRPAGRKICHLADIRQQVADALTPAGGADTMNVCS